MKTRIITDRYIDYDGRQLAPHWIYRNFDIFGNAAVAFIGSCRVDLSEMVDIEDVKAVAPIYSPLMLHIIAEFFVGDLYQTVFCQRLLVIIAKELLETQIQRRIIRKGDDLYITDGKLSVSIATISAVSTLVHTGFNIQTDGTPVSTAGLDELGIDAIVFANELLRRYSNELDDIWQARCKVRAVS